MATWELTPLKPHPITGLSESILGWQLSAASALDVFEGINVVFAAGWVGTLGPLPDSPVTSPIWQLRFTRGTDLVVVGDPDWFVFDGQNLWCITNVVAHANYSITQYTRP